MSKIPVIIAAYNEASFIGQTLDRLDSATTSPIVVVNGELGAQETIEVAERYTDDVHHLEEQGKLPAIQYALRTLLSRDRLLLRQPVILTDADTYPLFPRSWGQLFDQHLQGIQPGVATGLTAHHDGPVVDRLIRSMRKIRHERQVAGSGDYSAVSGSNMALNLGNDETFQRIQALPHIWPSEDRYLARTVAESSEDARFIQLTSLRSIVGQSMRFSPSVWSRIKNGQAATLEQIQENYAARKASTVTHFVSPDHDLVAYEHSNIH